MAQQQITAGKPESRLVVGPNIRLLPLSAVPRVNRLHFDPKMPRPRGGAQGRGVKKKQPAQPAESNPNQDPRLKPLAGKVFYLDITSRLLTDRLGRDIKALGGTVEGFLSKDITCLVTNKKEVKSQTSLAVLATIAKSESLVHGGEGRSAACSQTAEGPYTSRGKPVLRKMTDEELLHQKFRILLDALNWGVDIQHFDDFGSMCSLVHYEPLSRVLSDFNKELEIKKKWVTYLQSSGKGTTFFTKASRGRKAKRKMSRLTKMASFTVTELQHPFLKVEDFSKKYKPCHITYPAFRSFQPDPIPVSNPLPKRTPVKRAPKQSVLKREAAKQEAAKRAAAKRLNKTWHGKPAETPVNKVAATKIGYCECCLKKYIDVAAHLESEEHQKYATGPHYQDVDDIIASFELDLVDWLRAPLGAQSAPIPPQPVTPQPRRFPSPNLQPPTNNQMPHGMEGRPFPTQDNIGAHLAMVWHSDPVVPIHGQCRYLHSRTNDADSPLKRTSSPIIWSLDNNRLPAELSEPLITLLNDSLQRGMVGRADDAKPYMDNAECAQGDQNCSSESAGCSSVKRLKMGFTLEETVQESALPPEEKIKSNENLEDSCPLGQPEASCLPSCSTPSKLQRKVTPLEWRERNQEELPGTTSCKVSIPLEAIHPTRSLHPSRDLLEGLFRTSDINAEFHGFSCNTVGPVEEDDADTTDDEEQAAASHEHVLQIFSHTSSSPSTFIGF
ncbi:protein DBF4 homolog A [Leptodactylus fuscus]|uniref:protein DBF4 homolog A n=1 Tax=Leptodactylus fuscus TaxID=238119 RepID=UPI003F4F15DA